MRHDLDFHHKFVLAARAVNSWSLNNLLPLSFYFLNHGTKWCIDPY